MGTSQHDVLRVSTSDNVGIGYDIAGLGSRFIAQLLDSLVVGVIALLIDIPVAAAVNGSDTRQKSGDTWTMVDQIGRPAINTVFNHGADKELFNVTPPSKQDDAGFGHGT